MLAVDAYFIVRVGAFDRFETEAYLGWRSIYTEQLLSQPWHWAAVEALAAELLRVRRVGGARARAIIHDAITGWR